MCVCALIVMSPVECADRYSGQCNHSEERDKGMIR